MEAALEWRTEFFFTLSRSRYNATTTTIPTLAISAGAKKEKIRFMDPKYNLNNSGERVLLWLHLTRRSG
jgi:hypothetical protein